MHDDPWRRSTNPVGLGRYTIAGGGMGAGSAPIYTRGRTVAGSWRRWACCSSGGSRLTATVIERGQWAEQAESVSTVLCKTFAFP